MQKIILSALLFLGALGVSAQQEVFFNDTDNTDIKVSKSIQGLSLGTNVVKMFGDMDRDFMIDLRYFHEDRIAPTMTMYSFVGLQNDILQDRSVYVGGMGSFTSNPQDPMKTYYNLNMQLGTEWRWYFGYRSRYKRQQRTTNNIGWFLGVPLTFTTYLLHQPNGYYKRWGVEAFSFDLSLALKLGYRYTFGKHWLAEGALSYVPGSFGVDRSGSSFYMNGGWREMFRLDLKAAYTF